MAEQAQIKDGGDGFLPQSQDEVIMIKEMSKKDPQKIVQRMDYLMTELSFLMDLMNFDGIDESMSHLVQQHLAQIIDIAENKRLLMLEDSVDVLDQQKKHRHDQNERMNTDQISTHPTGGNVHKTN